MKQTETLHIQEHGKMVNLNDTDCDIILMERLPFSDTLTMVLQMVQVNHLPAAAYFLKTDCLTERNLNLPKCSKAQNITYLTYYSAFYNEDRSF